MGKKLKNEHGFSPIEAIAVITIVIVIGAVGWLVYRQHHKTSNISESTSSSSQHSTDQTTSNKAHLVQTAQRYLDIKEWGVELPLSSAISDAYYVVATNTSDTAWIGLSSLSGDCNANNANTVTSDISAIGGIIKVTPTQIDPGTGVTYESEYPGAVIGGYYYGYMNETGGKTCASATQLQSINSAFATAANGIISDSAQQYLDITQWGVRLSLNSYTSSLYYYINSQLPNVAYLSLSTISNVAPLCAADKTSLGAISRLTDAEQQAAASNGLQPGTIQIGDYWYGFSKPNAGCTNDSAAVQAALNASAPNPTAYTIEDAFNTLAANQSAN